jgi:hypothetical protein
MSSLAQKGRRCPVHSDVERAVLGSEELEGPSSPANLASPGCSLRPNGVTAGQLGRAIRVSSSYSWQEETGIPEIVRRPKAR